MQKLILLSLVLLSSCGTKVNEPTPKSLIGASGVTGVWTITERYIQFSLLPPEVTGEFIHLDEIDSTELDNTMGLWEYIAPNTNDMGYFSLDTANKEVRFYKSDSTLRLEGNYTLSASQSELRLSYSDDSLSISEVWEK